MEPGRLSQPKDDWSGWRFRNVCDPALLLNAHSSATRHLAMFMSVNLKQVIGRCVIVAHIVSERVRPSTVRLMPCVTLRTLVFSLLFGHFTEFIYLFTSLWNMLYEVSVIGFFFIH